MSPVGQQLEARVADVRAHLMRRAGLAVALWIVAALSLILIAAWVLSGPAGWRTGSDVPFVLDGLGLVLIVAAVLAFRIRSAVLFGDVPLSSVIERASGLHSGLLRGSLELVRDPSGGGASSGLVSRAVYGTARNLEGRSAPELAGTLGDQVATWARRGRGIAAMGVLLLVGLTLASPTRSSLALAGLASPLATMSDPVLPPLVVQPGDIEVLRGTDVTLEIAAAGRQAVEVAWQAAGDIARTEAVTVTDGRGTYTFRTVSSDIEYRVTDAEGNSSGRFTIVPVDPLFVSDLVLTVVYPPHTQLPEDEYRGDPPPLRLPAGSMLTFEGATSRPLSSVRLLDSLGAGALDFDIQGTTFGARWSPRRSGAFEWSFRDEMGGPAEIQPEPLEISVVADIPPTIAISMPGRDTVMPLNLRQPLVLESTDDYGLRRVELVAYRVTSFGERMTPVTQGFDIGGQRAILARPLLNLGSWGLLPGDTVRYFARAIDNSPGAQATVSPEYVLRMPEAAELRRDAEEAFEAVAERLEELAAEADRQATENREQTLQADPPAETQPGESEGAPDFQQREEMQRALEEQRQMASAVDSLQAEMDALERRMEEAGQADPELRRQLEELQEMLSQMTGDDLKRRMEEMSDALSQENLDQANRSLEEMAAEQEEFRDRLEEALERFRQAALEQDLRATTSEAEELARQEQALADALKEADDPELRARQQQELAQQSETLEQNMEALQERLAEMGETEAAAGVEDARNKTAEARQKMQEAQAEARQGDNQEAGDRAQEAADEMEEAAREMQQAMQEMAQQEMEAQQQALRQTADDALSLARRQSEVREQMRGASQEQLTRMREQEASLLQGVQNVAQNLQVASEGAMGQNRELSAQMGLAMESLQKTIEAMEGRRGATPSAAAQAEQAIGDLNQLALMAIAGAEQMGQQGQGEGGEEMSEQLQQLAQQQGDIMNQSTQLMPMQLGEQAMSEQMQQMSQGQESVASDLGELADEPGSEESLGDLQELAREAQMLAQDMAMGRLTPELVERQERLFHRLLDAGRSLEREEFSEERESEQPGAFERGQVMSLTAEQMGVMPYEVPDGAQMQRLSPAVRQLVLEYFERLNRTRPGGGGA